MSTFVVRGGAGKDVRGAFGRLLGTFMGATKPQVVKKGARSIVVVPIEVDALPARPTPAPATTKDETSATKAAPPKKIVKYTWAWWTEGNDLVVVLGKGGEDILIGVIDSKIPSALDHPVRLELARTEGAFTPIGQLFLEKLSTAITNADIAAAQDYKLTAPGVTRVDFRWGFQDDALVTIARVKSPRPRRGFLAALDQPTFDKAKLPPLPEGIESFTVVSVDADKSYDQFLANAPSDEIKAQLTSFAETLKVKSRIDLKKDVLARLGPNFAFYVLPGSAAPAAVEKTAEKTAAPPSAAALTSTLGLGAMQLPRLTLVTEVDDLTSFLRTLDNLMLACNKEFKERAYEAAEKAPQPKAETKGDQAKARREAPVFMEFRRTPSKDEKERSYVLNIPAPLAKFYPPGFRPTIRFENKRLVVATTPDAARQAIEVKSGEWTPPADLVPALELLPSQLMVLGARDPRGSLPETLASLPGSIQSTANALIQMQAYSPALAEPGAAARPVSPGMPPPVLSNATATPFVFNIPVSKLPKAEEIRSRLFPAVFGISADDQEIRLTSRVAFPNVVSPSSLLKSIMALRVVSMAMNPPRDEPSAAEAPATSKSGTSKTAKGASKSLIPKD